MWKVSAAKNFNLINAQKWLNQLYPAEVHSVGGDCVNPKCDYEFTAEDEAEMARDGGWFTCPNCDLTYNYLDEEPGVRYNRVGMSPTEMGNLGEKVVEGMGTIPFLGPITMTSALNNFPIDLIAGEFGVEVKTNHSESQPRFKLGGGAYGINPTGKKPMQEKANYCFQNGLRPALCGVRLNFYTNKADIFVRPDSFTDTWIGATALQHAATVDFTALNPYKNPHDVPPPNELPYDDDIPF
jgi:hypothetical protein